MALDGTLHRLEEKARASIRAAFASSEEPRPSDVDTDHCPECRDTAARFLGRRWDEISAATLRIEPKPSIALLTPAAFRYYAPALMLACIEAPRELDVVPQELVGSLSPRRAQATGDAAERLHFSVAQASAILAFLRVIETRQRIDSGLPEEARDSAPLAKPLARAMRFWTARAGSDD